MPRNNPGEMLGMSAKKTVVCSNALQDALTKTLEDLGIGDRDKRGPIVLVRQGRYGVRGGKKARKG